jgi:hypothetical protein
VGYDGFLSLEMGQYREAERYAGETRQALERVLDEVGAAEVST